MRKISLIRIWRKISIVLLFLLLFLIIQTLLTPTYQEPIFHPLAKQELLTPSGDKVEIQKLLPHKDYLITFIINSSPTSQKQLKEIQKISNLLPDNLAVIFIHCGRVVDQLKELNNTRFTVLIDAEVKMARKMDIYSIPTLLLLANDQREFLYSKKFVPEEELVESLERLKNYKKEQEAQKKPPRI